MAGRGALLVTTIVASALMLALPAAPAIANWLTRILHEAGETGGKVLRRGPGGLEQAQSVLKRLPVPPKGGALAATVSPEGHWTFMNAAGEAFTAGTPDELKRVSQILLAPGAQAESTLTLLLTEEAVFEQRLELAKLPKGSELRLVAGDESYPLLRPAGYADQYAAEVRPNLLVNLTDHRMFRETQWQLGRRLDKVRARVLALEPGGPATLSPLPRIDEATRRAITDQVDPYMLGDALRAIPGQTAVVAGRIDGRLLYFRPTGGPERTLNLEDLIKAAEASDVNLIVLQSSTPRQPGGRNWLWQRVTVAGLEDGMARATLSDFLSALADGQNRLLVTASARPNGRVALRAVPLGGQDLAPTSGGVGRMLSDIVSEVTGRVVTSAIDGDLVGSERQLELEARVIPGVPASIQVGYLVLVITGLMGMPVAAAWWRRAWPPEKRESYGRAFGYQAARLIRLACFLLVFLPTVGLPAFVWNLVLQTWSMVRAPVRALRWLAARASQPAT